VNRIKDPVSPAWYLLALAVFAIGWNGGVWWAGSAWDQVREARITSANQALQAEGASIAVFTDVVQPGRTITCVLVDVVRQARPQPMGPAPIPLTVDDDGITWQLVAFENDGRDNVTVKCAPDDKQVDNAQYAYATVDGYNTRLWTGNIVSIASIVVAVAVGVVVFRIRRRQLRAQ
jgi:hypothetical protein